MRFLLFLLALPLLVAPPAGAAEAKKPLPPLPVAAAACANCHGTDGRLHGPIPAIAGRPAILLIERLREFRADRAVDATVMPRLVKGLTEAEIEAVARYFSQFAE